MALSLADGAAPALSAPARAEVQRRFDPESIKPARGSARKASLEAREAGNHVEARARALAGIAGASVSEAQLLRWIAAQSARELGEIHAAAELLRPIAESEHPLASWARLSLAECYESRDPVHALALLDGLLAPTREVQGWPGRTPAERARARVLVKLDRRDDAILALEQLAGGTSGDEGATLQVLSPLLELLAQGDDAQRLRAYALARQVSQRAPGTRAGTRADELAAGLLKSFPSHLRDELTRARPQDRLQRADALLAELRYREAASAYLELQDQAEEGSDLACRAAYGRGRALLDSRARSEGASVMLEAVEHCGHDDERRVWARYQAGRALSALGQNERAIAQFEALEQEAPTHSLADDALYRAARAARDMGDPDGLVSRLQTLATRYPHGDMHLRAHFALAWEAHAQGDLAGALALLAADSRDESTEDVQGRSAYFRARWLAESGDTPAAVDAYAVAFDRAPLSFYGQLAHAHLARLAPERAHALTSKLSRARGERLVFEHRPELASAGFRRATALLEVGEVSLASWELKGLGFTADSADVELALLSVALLDRADAPELSVQLARRHMPRLLQRSPTRGNVALYELVYPVAFAPIIETTAKREGVPAAFLRAVAREESGFNPTAVSRAHAYGLVQLLVPTARSLVQTRRERVRSGSTLLEPQLNLTLGARFMGSLASGLRGQYALVPAAYNAGPAAVSRWLRERGAQPLDEFVENIPYDETRQYTRRVVQSYGVYHWLATAEMLQLPLGPIASLPADPLK